MKLGRIAEILGATLAPGSESLEIDRLASPSDADTRSIVFLSDPKYRCVVDACNAGAVIAPPGSALEGKAVLEVKDPYLGFARVGQLFEETSPPFETDQSAYIHPTAKLAASATVGPLSVIGKNVVVGEGSIISAGCVIEKNVTIGNGCLIESGAVIRRNCTIGNRVIIQSGAVIGSEGFGNARDGARWVRIPSFGKVIIEDDVWIGACSTIDRGALGPTTIGRGAIIDNLVHLAHNVTIGEDTAIAAQTGISGSTTIGKRVILAGQTGFVGHIEIGDDSFVGAQSGVSKSIPPGSKITGYPARDFMKMRRIEAAQTQLPDLLKEVKSLRKRIEELEKNK